MLHTSASGSSAPVRSWRAAAITPRVIQWLGASPLRARSNWPTSSSSSRPPVASDFLAACPNRYSHTTATTASTSPTSARNCRRLRGMYLTSSRHRAADTEPGRMT